MLCHNADLLWICECVCICSTPPGHCLRYDMGAVRTSTHYSHDDALETVVTPQPLCDTDWCSAFKFLTGMHGSLNHMLVIKRRRYMRHQIVQCNVSNCTGLLVGVVVTGCSHPTVQPISEWLSKR